MEIQLFDGERLIFRAHPGEPLYPLLPEGELDAERLRAGVEDELRRLLPSALPGPYERELDVLGERVRVDVRNPQNRELIRASNLETALRSAAGPLRAIAVPKLEPPVFRLATLLKASGSGVAAAELQQRLRDQIEALEPTLSNDETRAALRREAAATEDPRAVFALVSQLRDAGLAEEGDDGVVRPTGKLRLIVL